MPARYQRKKDFPRLTQRCTDLGGSFIYKYVGRRMLGNITVIGRGQAVERFKESKVQKHYYTKVTQTLICKSSVELQSNLAEPATQAEG
jgi:hypothetical protein